MRLTYLFKSFLIWIKKKKIFTKLKKKDKEKKSYPKMGILSPFTNSRVRTEELDQFNSSVNQAN